MAKKKTVKKLTKQVSKRALNKLSNSDLIAHLAKTHNFTASQAKEIVKDTFSFIETTIKKGKSFSQIGFGTFKKTRTKARRGTNPNTGEPLRIKAGNKVSFSPGERIKRLINN